jgi:hypothetical protein
LHVVANRICGVTAAIFPCRRYCAGLVGNIGFEIILMAIGNASFNIGWVESRVALNGFCLVGDRQRPLFSVHRLNAAIVIIVIDSVGLKIYRNAIFCCRIAGPVIFRRRTATQCKCQNPEC